MSFDQDNPNPHSEDIDERRAAREKQIQLSRDIEANAGNSGGGGSSAGCLIFIAAGIIGIGTLINAIV